MTTSVDLRLFRPDDLPALFAVVDASAEYDQADERFTLETFPEELATNNDPEKYCILAVLPDGRIAGYAYIEQRDDNDRVWGYGWGTVHPGLRRQGIGRQLVRAAEARFAEFVQGVTVGERAVFMQRFIMSTNPGEVALALSEGYTELRSSYRMRITLDGDLPAPEPSPGITLRPFDPAREMQAVFEVDQAAFMDGGWQPLKQTFADWRKHHVEAERADPALLWSVALDDATGEIAGVVMPGPWGPDHPDLAWINRLGVLRAYRGRGVGEALLRQGLLNCRAAGYPVAGLGVRADNPGALKLYTRAGMDIYCRFTHYRKVLRGDPAQLES